MSSNQIKLVKVTHVINPSRFYCLDLSEADEESIKVAEIEARLVELAKIQSPVAMKLYEPAKGDNIAYYCAVNKKWIRCEIDEYRNFNNELTLILWASDYGCPLYTTNLTNVFKLPTYEAFPCSKIFAAGLSVLASTDRFDHIEAVKVTEFNKVWNPRAVEFLKKCTSEKSFELFFERSSKESHHQVVIGDLYVKKDSMVLFGLSSKLLEMKLAVAVPGDLFIGYYDRLTTNCIERWNDNLRTGGVMKNPEGVMHMVPLTFQKLDEYDDNKSIYSEHLQFSELKVLDWQRRNDQTSPDKTTIDEMHSNASFKSCLTVVGEETSNVKQIKNYDVESVISSFKYMKPYANRTSRTDAFLIKSDEPDEFKPDRRSPCKEIYIPAGASITSKSLKSLPKKLVKTGNRILNNPCLQAFQDDDFDSVSVVAQRPGSK